MAILLKGLILPIGGVASGRVCACILRSGLVFHDEVLTKDLCASASKVKVNRLQTSVNRVHGRCVSVKVVNVNINVNFNVSVNTNVNVFVHTNIDVFVNTDVDVFFNVNVNVNVVFGGKYSGIWSKYRDK